MLEIGLVVGTRSEQHDAWIFSDWPVQAKRASQAERNKERRHEPLHVALPEHRRQRTRKDDTIFQRIARAGRGLRAVAEHRELPVLGAYQVGGIQMKPAIVGQLDAVARPEKPGIGPLAVPRRKQTSENRFRRTIQIGQQTI